MHFSHLMQIPWALPEPKVERLSVLSEACSRAQIVWLNASAGFGKTALMGEYARQINIEQDLLWLSLHAAWQQDEALLSALLHSFSSLSKFNGSAQEHWRLTQQRGRVDVEQVLLHLLDGIAAYPRPILLCLDDVHTLGEGSGWQLLLRLLEMLPKNLSVLLASRYLPAPLGRVRLLSSLAWLTEAELSFTDTQTHKWLSKLRLSDVSATVARLSPYLQGWPAGLVIWLNAYQSNAQLALRPELAQDALADYLAGEVLSQIPLELTHFLRLCAVLGRFNEAMLQHFYQGDQYHQLLQHALRHNLFIRSQPSGAWLVMHPVMAQVLAQQVPLHERQKLHRDAFFWLSAQPNQAVSALQHALKAQMVEEVQDWVLQQSEQILASLDISGLLRWFTSLKGSVLEYSPRLQVIACWVYLLTGQSESAAQIIDSLVHKQPLPTFEYDALQGYLARLTNQLEQAQELCSRAFLTLPKERALLRFLMATTLSQLSLIAKNSEQARSWNLQAQELAHHSQSQSPNLAALSLFDAARLEINQGQINHGRHLIARSLSLLPENKIALPSPLGRVLLFRAWLLLLSGEHSAELEQCLQQGIALGTEMHDIYVCYGYAIRALRAATQNDFQQALDEVDSAQWLMQRWRVEPKSYLWLDFLRINIWLSQGDLLRAKMALDLHLTGRTLNDLPASDAFPMLPKLAQLTMARLLLLSNQAKACLAWIDQGQQVMGSALGKSLLELIRAAALHSQNPNEAQKITATVVRFMQRENVSLAVLNWLPGLREPLPTTQNANIAPANLSERELDVLKNIAKGLSNQEIADTLFISLHTVKTHARKINTKLAAKNRTQALHRAQELKLI